MDGPPDAARESLPPIGEVLAERYRLLRLIATGGMGSVFEAHDQAADRAVALKILHPELTSDPSLRRRFRRESSVLLALDHPSIVRLFDVGETGDAFLFSVMELLEGETLGAFISRAGPQRPTDLLPLVHGIADGLEAAHAHGVIHGDLNPANVFMLSQPSGGTPVKLLDFGLSKVLGLERLTNTGELLGTPAYMAPEQLTGKSEPDGRIDTYALGVVLYECLAGRPPYEDTVPGRLMMAVVMGKAPPLREVAPHVGEDVAAVVAQAMSGALDRRFSSAAALSRAFTAAASGG